MARARRGLGKAGEKPTRDAEKTRRNILEAAIRLYARKGIAATTIRDISMESGENSGLIYYYFDDKQDLFDTALSESVNEALVDVIRVETEEKGSARARLAAISKEYLKVLEQKPEVGLLLIRGLLTIAEPGDKPFAQLLLDRISAIEKVVKAGQRKGELKKCNPTAFAFTLVSIAYSGLFGNMAAMVVPANMISPTRPGDQLKIIGYLLDGLEV